MTKKKPDLKTVLELYVEAKAAWRANPSDPDVAARLSAAEAALVLARASTDVPPTEGAITPEPIAGRAGVDL